MDTIKKYPKVAGICLFFLLLASMVLGLKLGYVDISWQELFTRLATLPASIFSDTSTDEILFSLRAPRVTLAAITGAGLALAGTVMQATLGNPLADPYILGVSSGATLGAVCAIFLGANLVFGLYGIGMAAAIGALVISFLVITLASIGRGMTTTKLLLSGMAFQATSTSFASLIIFLGSNKDGMQSLAFWLLGNVANVEGSATCFVFAVTMAIFFFFCTQTRSLDLMLFGGQDAVTLGVNVQRARLYCLGAVSILLGALVSVVGLVGFIGLIVPHMSRLLFGSSHRILLPLVTILGAFLGVWADILGRIIIPGIEIPFGVTLALLGGPFFLYLVLTKSYTFREG